MQNNRGLSLYKRLKRCGTLGVWANSNPRLTGVNMPILNGKKVVDLEVDGVVSGDYPDFCDAYFSNGCYEDGTPLTEDELNHLTILAGDVLWEMAFESLT